MRLDGVEHWDHFQDETIYWLDLSDMPEPIQQAARRIDGKAYEKRNTSRYLREEEVE